MPGLSEVWRAEVEDYVIAMRWSPDGNLVAAASASGPISIFCGQTGEILSRPVGHGFGATDLSWNDDGTLLATAGQDGFARVWNAATGIETLRVEGGSHWVEHLCYSPSGLFLATAAAKKLRVWDRSGNLIRQDADTSNTIAALAWQPGTDILAAASYGRLSVVDVQFNEQVRTFHWKGSMLAMAWSCDGRTIATGDQDATAHFWDLETGRDLMMWGYQTKVRELSWDASGRYLATGGGPRVTVWDRSGAGPEGSEPILLADRRAAPISALAFHPSKLVLAAGDQAGGINLWEIDLHANRLATVAVGSEVTGLAWHPSGTLLAARTAYGNVILFRNLDA